MSTVLKTCKYAMMVAAMALMVPTGGLNAQPAGDTDLSLQEAVAKGVLTNPEYGIVANDRRAVDEELNQAKALYYPSIDFLADAGFEHTDTELLGEEDMFRRRASLTLTQCCLMVLPPKAKLSVSAHVYYQHLRA